MISHTVVQRFGAFAFGAVRAKHAPYDWVVVPRIQILQPRIRVIALADIAIFLVGLGGGDGMVGRAPQAV